MMSVLKHPSMQETEPEPEPTSPPKLHIVGDLEGKEWVAVGSMKKERLQEANGNVIVTKMQRSYEKVTLL